MNLESAEFNNIEIEEILKLEINNLIWMYSPNDLTLEKAEKLSLKIGEMIMKGKNV